MKLSNILLLFLTVTGRIASAQQTTIAFTLKEKDLILEGLTYDSIYNVFYAGSIHKRKIITLVPGKSAVDFITEGQDQIGEVLGLRVDALRRLLWVCNNSGAEQTKKHWGVHVYDLATRKLIKKFELPPSDESHLFNDLVITKTGDVYITDSDFSSIYKVSLQGKLELFLTSEQLVYCNGITLSTDEKKLIVSSFKGVYQIDLTTKKMERMNLPGYHVFGLDGLYTYKRSLIGIQNTSFPESINQYFLSEDKASFSHAEVLATNLPEFDMPTTGVIAGDWFYFIANSQLGNYEKGEIIEESKLKDVVIMKVRLR